MEKIKDCCDECGKPLEHKEKIIGAEDGKKGNIGTMVLCQSCFEKL